MSDHWRPRWHYTAARNWINDPNGLIFDGGEVHLFYQYDPFGDQWGHMSWGHAVSTDLLHWQELPVAIAEDERVSIFSGSIVIDVRNSAGFGVGAWVAIYTGCLRRPEPGQGGQAQELAFSTDRGRTWTKYAYNPVLDLGLREFRDPKVFWHAPTARWTMAVVLPEARTVVFYASPDLKTWTELSRFADDLAGQGIWECPDLFELPIEGEAATAWLLKVDVFEGHPSQGSGARLFMGHFDGTRFIAEPSAAPQWADHGADFYAALSWANLPTTPARALWIGWMNCHRYAKLLPTSPWRGAMSVPRELTLVRGSDGGLRLRQQPLRELALLRGARQAEAQVEVRDGEHAWLPAGFEARSLDIELTLDAGACDECGLLLRAGAAGGLRVGVDRTRGVVFVDRSCAHLDGGFAPDDLLYATRREAPCAEVASGRALRLRVLLDACSVEVFADDGAVVITEQFLPGPEALGVSLYAQGGAARFRDLLVHEIARSIGARR
jgi:fructan beta-fructosidase